MRTFNKASETAFRRKLCRSFLQESILTRDPCPAFSKIFRQSAIKMADSGQQQAIASAKPAKLPKLATLTLAEALQQLAAYQDEMEATQGPVSPEHNARVVCKLRRLMLRTHLVGARDLRAGKRRLRQVDKLHKVSSLTVGRKMSGLILIRNRKCWVFPVHSLLSSVPLIRQLKRGIRPRSVIRLNFRTRSRLTLRSSALRRIMRMKTPRWTLTRMLSRTTQKLWIRRPLSSW